MTLFRVEINRSEFDRKLDTLVNACDSAVRPAAQAGAQVFYDQIKRNVDKIGVVTGNLKSSIYQVYSKDNSKDGERSVYHVSWNTKKAPHGHLLEYGHMQKYQVVYNKKTGKWITLKNKPLANPKQVAARPFVRPAYESHGDRALTAMEDAFYEAIGRSTVA